MLSVYRVTRRPSISRTLIISILILALASAVATVTGLARSARESRSVPVEQAAVAPQRTVAVMPVLAVVAGATINVNSTDDVLPVDGSDGKCTLREAINAANTNTALSGVSGECVAGSGDDTINFDPTVFVAPGPQTINLKGALPFIGSNLIINGSGAKLLTIRRDTGGDYNIFNVGQIVTISGLTITNGLGTGGGGINSGGTLTINDCAISGNTVSGGTGERNGGGIYNTGTLTINNSTISGNTANATDSFFSFGGGIFSESGATLIINNSTISGNTAKDNGGGVEVFGGQATLTNVTISNNHSNNDDNGGSQGGGLMRLFGTILLNNTIIAGNFQGSGTTTPQDLGGFSFAPASSNNLIGADSGNSGLTNGVNGNKIGSTATPIDARLAALADNGGPTRTHALLPGSPAIDAGNNTIAANAGLTLDQRGTGFLRIVDGDGNATANVDIGAFEIQGLVVNVTGDASDTDTSDGICDSNAAAGEQCTLRAAIEQANARPGTDAINFSLPGAGPHIIELGTALPNLSSNIRINGSGANVLTVRRSTVGGTQDFRIFWVSNGQEASISGLTISNGKTVGSFALNPQGKGGAIYNDHGTLRISNCTLSGNSASIYGGAIFNDGENNSNGATLTLTNSTISGNQAGQGGAIYNDGISGNAVLILSNSTISGNDAAGNGGAIYNDANAGSATLIATNCTITNNRADTNINDGSTSTGGGLSLASIFSSQVVLRNTIVAGNFVGPSPATTADDVRGFLDGANSSFNLIGTCPNCGLSNGTNNNQVGVTDARLGSLVDNGGPTQTHALLAGSPALDQGSNALIPQDTADLDGDNDTTEPVPFDQRGPAYPRKADAADADTLQTVDIGAFEAHPSIEDISDKTIAEDGGLSYSFNYGDKSLGVNSITFASSNTALISNHNILCHPFASSCSDLIVPASNQSGSAIITITITANNGASMSDTFTVTVNPVNDAPTLDAIGNLTINEEAPLQTVNLTGISAGGGESQTLTITATSDNTALILNPTVTYTSPNATGSLSFTPVANQSGSALITVTVNDSGGTANGGINTVTRTFTVTVNPVNDGPVNTVPGAQTTEENVALTFSAANSNLISIADVDVGVAGLEVTLTATNGTLTLSKRTGLAFTVGEGTDDAKMNFTGNIVNINSALAGMVFTPTSGFHGAASVQIKTDDQGNTGSGGALTDTDTISITVIARNLKFNSTNYTASEGAGHATITVIRGAGLSNPASVDYETSDMSGLNNCNVNTGNASSRCDYTAVAGTLNFIAGQSSATFDIPIVNDVYVEGPETLTVTLTHPAGGILGTPATATLTITDDDLAPGAANPIDDPSFFIRQHYMDVLNREPEPSGLADWLAILNNCPAGDKSCDRIQVSSGFFRSPESFDRAYFVYRFYETALGRKPDYDEYQRDLRQVAGFLTEAELEARKAAFAEEFTKRAEFKARYDAKADGDEYVNAIVATAGVTPSNRTDVSIRQGALVITRGQALRELLESPEISQHFFNRAFVVVGYFAYLRRDPDALYLVWIDKLNNPPAGQSYEDTYREMIGGFIGSQEYRSRFGLP